MPRKKKKPFNRLPNGFGSIKKLSGNRRNPYYVCGPERRVHGVKIPGEKIGSAQSWEEAYQMLALWWAGKKKKTLPQYNKKRIKVDTTDDRDIDVYASDEPQDGDSENK